MDIDFEGFDEGSGGNAMGGIQLFGVEDEWQHAMLY
jgi:hypothetical protein